jgi:hypothetical protein
MGGNLQPQVQKVEAGVPNIPQVSQRLSFGELWDIWVKFKKTVQEEHLDIP